jgi:hypothetical protein
MDTTTHERQGQAPHGLVKPRPVLTVVLVACVAAALLAGILGGLLRVGVVLPVLGAGGWVGRGALAHAALMMCGFLGTVICVERAVAAKRPLAWLPALVSAAAGAALLLGQDGLARVLLPLAAAAFVAVNMLLWKRQPASHTGVLVAGAGAWLVGNTLYAFGAGSHAILPWWFGFLVLTIAAERLEMTRLMRRRPGAEVSLHVVLQALAVGAALAGVVPVVGGVLFGAALLALACWLLVFDIARRTIRADGLSRYMAVCLLTGYGWLGFAGAAWAATALGHPARDAALHALGLGFIFSMMMGHAPVILPAIARVKILFGPWFYLPLALLHASLLWRLVPGLADLTARAQGAAANAIAIALFAATVAASALAWRRRHGARPSSRTRTPP